MTRSASGAVLGRYPFAPEWESSTRTRRLISFACRVPFTDDIAYSSDGGVRSAQAEIAFST